jgi:hypothetical protein
MTHSAATSFLSIFLTTLLSVPQVFGQAPETAASNAPVLHISVLEGNNAINSLSSGRSVTPVVEVRDQNDFPVEGATVTFTLPASGPGGTFRGNQVSYSARSDSHGQVSAPFLVNGLAGKFRIQVTATAGNRKGEAWIAQTNATGEYAGVAAPRHPWYKKWYVWAVIGGAAAGVATWAATRNSGSAPGSSSGAITITAGGPVFH